MHATPLLPDGIRHAVLVRAERERVYDALTTAAGLDGWFTTGATVDARPGGEIRFRWRDWGPERITDEDGGPVLEARRPERFVFQWQPDRSGEPTTVEVDFEAVEGGTVIRLREHGYQDTPTGRRQVLDCAAGWGEALTLLKFYVEHGIRY
ncbi:MAG TPA: SRPBCC domain-containing protein [Longimicrobiaceae bacterium]|nr:SRPBCC domain-containing protein [Longimicrobiaceae bacterium]